jgi:release factor glutamine methyltransferase
MPIYKKGESFTTLIDKAEKKLKKAKVDNPKLNAEILLSHVLKTDRLKLKVFHDIKITPAQKKRFERLIEKRSERIPLQYITGYQNFMGLNIKVTPSALIPRPETEELVELALQKTNGKSIKILDLCCGSGCIACAISANSSGCIVVASDICKKALNVAKKNVKALKLKNIKVLQSNLFENINGKFDLIVSNPPYIGKRNFAKLPKEVLREPKKALYADNNGLSFIISIIKESPSYLNKNGWLMLETEATNQREIEKTFDKEKWSNVKYYKDFSKKERYVVAQLKNG